MKFRNTLPSLEEVKKTDIVEYLSTLGFKPSKIRRQNYWYLSPLRDEKNPSFKVNRNINRWYDFGEGKGGNIIDFGILYYQCNVSDLLKKLPDPFSFRQPITNSIKEDDNLKRIKVIAVNDITSFALICYLNKRRIPIEIANKYCREIHYGVDGRKYFAIGFQNSAGGYELRNEKFKSSISPKDVTLINNHASVITVFEGLFNFLSYQTMFNKQELHTNFLVLNSTSFFEKSLSLLRTYKHVHLYLDCDTTGQNCTQKAITIDKQKFSDETRLYKNYKDLNDWLMHFGQTGK